MRLTQETTAPEASSSANPSWSVSTSGSTALRLIVGRRYQPAMLVPSYLPLYIRRMEPGQLRVGVLSSMPRGFVPELYNPMY
ncbi:hypothetical protein DSM43518_04953 [Mycobacterium marinum]|nr:hypothetical protein DSM43518_04953 [Mycobacterium marinum]CDM78006.1 hypothetical protein MMARE11_38690 [Mycobacterium marinum E11]